MSCFDLNLTILHINEEIELMPSDITALCLFLNLIANFAFPPSQTLRLEDAVDARTCPVARAAL